MWFECIYAVIWVIRTLQLRDASKTDFPWHYGIENMFFSLYREKCKDAGAGSLRDVEGDGETGDRGAVDICYDLLCATESSETRTRTLSPVHGIYFK